MSPFKQLLVTVILAIGTAPIFGADNPSASPSSTPTDRLVVEALVTPVSEVDLAAPSEGLVMEIKVPEGSYVKKGEVIAQLSDEEEKILLRNSELQAKKFQEDLVSMERLYREKAASRDDYNKANLAAQQAAAERDLQAIRLSKRGITAPCDAYILRILKEPGESVQRMEKFAELVSTDRLHATAYVDARYLGKIKVGSDVLIRLPHGTEPVNGKVEVSDPVLDPGGAAFRVRVMVQKPGTELQPGTRVQIELLPTPLPGTA